jgi:hypothetical protein
MKLKHVLIFLVAVIATFAMSSCAENAGGYSAKKTGYYQKESKKFALMDMVVDCPQITKQPQTRSKGKKKKKKK